MCDEVRTNDVITEIKAKIASMGTGDLFSDLFKDMTEKILRNEKRVVLFGAGKAGKEFAECLISHNIKPLYFCDSNPQKRGIIINQIEVINIIDMLQLDENIAIVVSAVGDNKKSIINNIKKYTSKKIYYYENDEQFFYYLQHYKWKCNLNEIEERKKEVREAYEYLIDDLSRSIFVCRLAILAGPSDYASYLSLSKMSSVNEIWRAELKGNKKYLFEINCENRLYFNNDIIKLSNEEILIDGGAYDGDTALEFINACLKLDLNYKKIYCFEADPVNYKKLCEALNGKSNICTKEVALWNDEAKLKFASSEIMFKTEAGIIQEDKSNLVIKRDASDKIVTAAKLEMLVDSGDLITLIKLDIEGSEYQALQGAKVIIERHKPKLVISIYHKYEDVFIIANYLKKIRSDYKIYIRHFSLSLSETVLIAV